jgi:prolyl 4-hydroxylase
MSKKQSSSAPAHPDKAALAAMGAAVLKRIEANSDFYRLPAEKADIFALGGFMSESECARMRGLIDQVAKPSQAFSISYSSAFRTSYSGDVDPWDPFVRKIQRRFDDLLGIPGEYGETIQGQRYLPGQEFRSHCDWFHTEADYWDKEAARGGQRSWTAMVFLNDVEEGGMTDFKALGFSIQPTTGVLLTWNNANPKGEVNKWTLHAATPVVKGSKYIITKWYRTRKWG